jgi:hypothetical protein
MIAEVTASPSVFDQTAYSAPEICERQMESIKDALMHRSLLRDLRDGGLTAKILSSSSVSPRGKEILKKMRTRGRITSEAPCGSSIPAHESEWVTEGLQAHTRRPLGCVLTTGSTKELFASNNIVEDVHKMTRTAWWKESARVSWRVQRSRQDFLKHLEPLLIHANSLQFIEPFFDPSDRSDYGWFNEVIRVLATRERPASLEIHRGCVSGSGRSATIFTPDQIINKFSPLSKELEAVGLKATVFVWLEMHNRYLLTNIGGFQLGNSLIERPAQPKDTWSCLDRHTQDDIQREYDPSAPSNRFKCSFPIGAA